MPIREAGGIILFTPPDRLFGSTGVAYDDDFAVMDRNNLVKQIKFNVVPTTTGPGVLTLRANVAGDQTIDIGGTFAVGPSFGVIQADHGTSPTATIPTDTVTFTSSDSTVSITGNSSTNTVDFTVPDLAAITTLTGDVSASGPGSAAATVNSVGGSSAANVHAAELLANAATNANTASTIVKRDASGNFSAGTITAALTGNATNVTGIVAVAHGGTNSSTTLNNNRVVQSSGGAIVEAAAITAARALISDANGIPTHSAVTSTELGYVSGVTSAIQTQLGTKVTAVSVATANGLAGTSSGGTTPALTLTTTVSGLLKGNGTAISAAAAADLPTITLTGDVTGAASGGTIADTIAVGAVTDTKASLAVKPAIAVVATSNQTLSGLPTIDGVATAANTLVLLTAQTSGAENGPWQSQVGAWSRPTWYPAGGTTQAFQFITTFVRLGTTYQGSVWRMTTAGAITIDTTATTWVVTPISANASTLSGAIPVANGGTAATTAAGARTNLGVAIGSDVQAWDTDLDALAGVAATGLLARTASGTASARTVTGTANHITVTNGNGVSGNPTLDLGSTALTSSFGITIDGGGGVPTTGSKGYLTIPFAATITNWFLAADVSGSCVIDVKRSSTSIVGGGGNKPTLTSAQSGNAAVSGWTSTAIAANDIIEFNLDSVTTITRVNLVIQVTKT